MLYLNKTSIKLYNQYAKKKCTIDSIYKAKWLQVKDLARQVGEMTSWPSCGVS